jgi:tetratricopeptide (TPR) repeat protein
MSQALVDQKDLGAADSLVKESVELFSELKDDWGLALSLNDLGNVLRSKKEYLTALIHYRESLALWQKINDTWGIPLTLSNIGFLASLKGDYEESRRQLTEALKIQRKMEDKWGLAETLKCLGDVAVHLINYDEAAEFYRESLLLNQSIGRKQLMVACLEGLAMVANDIGKIEQAAHLSGAVESLRIVIGVPPNLTDKMLQKKYKALMGTTDAQSKGSRKFKSMQDEGRRWGLDQVTEYAFNELKSD